MQIVTDSGMDLYLDPADMPARPIVISRHTITLDGKSYLSGQDIQPKDLYQLLGSTTSFPTTSQPSAGEFAQLFAELAVADPDIMCVNMSSGLSGTFSAATTGAGMTPEARVTVVDTKTLSGVMGWQVAAAARAAEAGWSAERIVDLVQRIGAVSETMYTLDDLKYLIHGGRISHMKGLLANVLHLRPVIGVSKIDGKYVQMGQARTMDGAIARIVQLIERKHAAGTALRAQILHAANPGAAATLKEQMERVFTCSWLPVGAISPVLGAHVGPSLVGIGYAPLSEYPETP